MEQHGFESHLVVLHFNENSTMKIIMEIRAGEGGADAKLLMEEVASMYIRFAESLGSTVSIEDRGSL